ncbi:MAG TPA: choice-of-anchor J domain-containing protein, partial [Bacteroidales bacterium]|nr:choice-of-anchor J domain-containing protein [Bacteroidales bacterium]
VGDGAQGTILNVSITYATGYTYGTKIWVDWNNDLDFVDAGEQMYFGLSTNSNPTTLAASFTIPLATPLGNYRMRIGGTDNDAGPSTPCYTGAYGTFEDYTLQVIEVPPCLAPSGIAAVATGDATATVTWTASASLPADGYEIYFSELNVAPEETTPASGTVLAGVTSYDIAGLNPNTTYYVWVRSNCGAGEYSAWAGSVNFTTACVAIADYPYFEGFNQAQMPDCWSVNNVDADGYQWIPTTSYFYEGTHSVNVHWNTTANNDWLISPRFQITNPALVLDFYARSTSSSFLESFNVLVSTTGTSPADFSIVLDNIVDHQNAWVKHSYQLSDYGINPGDEIYIAIQCVSVDGFYLAVDAFSIREPNTGTDILTYSIPEQIEPATIDSDNHVIDLTVGFGTDLTGLISTFTLSNGASAAVGATAQQSGVTPNDFTSGSVIYTVTAEDGTTTQDWTVNVTVADVNHDTDILTFGFDEQTAPATIDAVNHSIAVNINWWSNISSLIADFTLSYGATATIEGVAQTSGVTVNDFLHTVIYNVMAEDGTTNQNWEVNVTQDPVPQGTTCNTAIPYTINDPDFMGYMPAQHQYYFLVTLPEDYINVRMMTCGSSFDTKLAYFVSCDNVPDLSTCPSNPAGAIGYVDDGGCGTQSYGGNSYASYLNIGNLSAGTYLVAVYGYSTTDQGDVQFRVLGDEIPVADLSVNVESGYTCPVAEFYVPVEILNSGETTVAAGEVVNFVLESGGNVLINENFTITADLAPGASEMFTTINSVDLSDAGSYDWTATINWVSDMVDANDVISGNMVSFEQSIEFVDAVNDTITVTEFPYTITANAVLTPDVPLTTEYLWNSGTITNTEIVNAEGWNYLTITTLTCTYYDSVFVQYVLPVRDLAVEFGSGYTCPIEDINVGVTLVNEGNVIVTAGTTLQFVFVIDGTEVIDEELVFEEDLAPSESVTLFTVNTIDLLTTGVYAFSGTILWSDDSNSSNNVSSGEVTVFEHSINFVDADNDTITVDAWPYTITANATTTPVIPFTTEYVWEDGTTGNTLEVNAEGWYLVTVTTYYCEYTDSVYVVYYDAIPTVTASNISVYPNPTSGSVNVEFAMPESGNVTVQVMDALGRTLSEIKMSDVVIFNESIDLSGYAEGVYSIRFIFDNQSITKRVTLRK